MEILVNSKEGFSLIKKEDEALFFDGFKKFTELSWQQIFINVFTNPSL